MNSSLTTTDVFLGSVRKSSLVKSEVLDSFLEQNGHSSGLSEDPMDLARKLIAQGFLTKFQAEQLLQGRWKNFQLAGKYNILERLSTGPMSTVFLCEHETMRRLVALKLLPAEKAKDPTTLSRFHREARAAARLRHPNVMAVYDLDRSGGLHFLVAEYVDGLDLERIVSTTGPMTIDRAADCIRQAAEGLQHAHEMGMVHRDIKPGNLLLDRSGTIKLLDLGLARLFLDESDGMTKVDDGRMLLGTIDYLAPEQAIDSHDVDIRADIYSLGATAFFLLSGRTLFNGASTVQKLAMHGHRPPEQIVRELTGIPRGFADILVKMLAKDPVDRYQTPAEVAEALVPWSSQNIIPPSAEELPRHCLATRRWVEKSRSTAVRVATKPTTKALSVAPVKTSSIAQVVRNTQAKTSLLLRRQQWSSQKPKRKGLSPKHVIAVGVAALSGMVALIWSFSGAASDGTSPKSVAGASSSSSPFPEETSATNSGESHSSRVSPLVLQRQSLAKLADHDEIEAAVLLHRRLGSNCSSMGAMEGLQMTILDLYNGHASDYRRDCQDIMEAYAVEGDLHDAEIVLKCCMHSSSPVLLEKVKALAARKFKSIAHTPGIGYWTKTTLALLAIRTDDLEEALELLEETGPLMDPNLPTQACLLDILAAITHAKLDNTKLARERFEKARHTFEEATANGTDLFKNRQQGIQWQDWYSYLILRREAEALLKHSAGSR